MTDRSDLPPVVYGRFAASWSRLSRGLGVAAYLALTTPFLMVFVLRVLGLYHGAISELLSSVGPAMLCGVAPLLFLLGRLLAWRRFSPGTLRLDGDALQVVNAQGASRIPLDRVVDGALEGLVGDGFRLKLADGRTVAATAQPNTLSRWANAREFLSALGLDASRRVATLRASAVDTPAFRAGWMFALMLVVTMMSVEPAPKPLLISLLVVEVVLAWVLASASIGPEVTVGVDGMRVRGVWRTVFHPWSEVTGVEVKRGALVATLAGGGRVRLGSATGPNAQALRERIGDARSAGSRASPQHEAATARGGRTVAAWRDAMGGLLGTAGYRAEAVSADDLDGVMRGGTATAEQRAGAAMALMASDPARHATGVRIAAEALADEPAREALEEIARGGGDDAVLERTARRS